MPTKPRISTALLALIIVVVVGGWQSAGLEIDNVPLDLSSVVGLAVVILAFLVFAFFMVKLTILTGTNMLHSTLLSTLFGVGYGPDAQPLFGAIAFGALAIGRTLHEMWSRGPIQVIEIVAFAAAIGLYCGSKLALADERAKAAKP